MILELENIKKTYPAEESELDLHVLNGISLRVDSGESIAIVGPSGSGKTTLLNIMGGLDKPTLGTTRINGQDISELSENDLAKVRNKEIGFVFQKHHLLPQCTVLENVLIPTLASGSGGTDQCDIERGHRLLDEVGLGERKDVRPAKLSGGECQRTAVVRALINQPNLLLADEPTGSLDHTSATHLADLLVSLNQRQQVTLIVVTHSWDLAKRMNRIYELQDGKLRKKEAK